jgi:hypothetical protein
VRLCSEHHTKYSPLLFCLRTVDVYQQQKQGLNPKVPTSTYVSLRIVNMLTLETFDCCLTFCVQYTFHFCFITRDAPNFCRRFSVPGNSNLLHQRHRCHHSGGHQGTTATAAVSLSTFVPISERSTTIGMLWRLFQLPDFFGCYQSITG